MGDTGEVDIDVGDGDDDGDVVLNEDGTVQICGDCCEVCFPECAQTPTNSPTGVQTGTCTGSLDFGVTYGINKAFVDNCASLEFQLWSWEHELVSSSNFILEIYCCCNDGKLFARVVANFTSAAFGGSDSSANCSQIPANMKDVTALVTCDSVSGNLTGSFTLDGNSDCAGATLAITL